MPPATSDPRQTTRLLDERIRALFKRLPKGLAGDEESIHQMRVMGRRLRCALPLLARKPEGRRVRRALGLLQRLTRDAGTSRDLDVIAGLFASRVAAEPPASAEARLLARRLKQARSRSRLRMAEALLDLDIARLRRDLRRVVQREAEDVFTALARLREAQDASGTALIGGFAALGERFDPEALHALRRRARRLRYAAEVGNSLRGQETGAPLLLRELQQVMGAVHDDFVLAGWLGRQAARAESQGRAALAAEARRHERHFKAECRRRHRELLGRNPHDLVARSLEAMGSSRPAA